MVESCCYFVPLDVGALLLGVITLIVSAGVGMYSIVLLGMEHVNPPSGANQLKMVVHLELDSSTVKIVLTSIVTVQILWMLFSTILIVGLRKNRPCCLLAYFSFGIVVAILMLLSGLLVLLKKHWILSFIGFISAVVYIHGLVVVYHAYELMQQGKVLNERSDDEEQLCPRDEREFTIHE